MQLFGASTLGFVDLSGLIFVALAIAWAAYLIPMALKRTDDLATTRAVEEFSSRLRVFGGRRAQSPEAAVPTAPAAAPTTTVITTVRPADRAAARRAARRRRRVLYVLVSLTAITAVVAGLGYLPYWAIAAPVVLIVAFLVIARVSVRRERARRHRIEVIVPAAEPPAAQAAPAVPASVEASDVEETIGLSAQALAEVRADAPLADEASLWDPVPVTLPTYVTKPRARRTVRTIELTQSSGHDVADSKLARDAEAARAAQAKSEKAEPETPRKAAGA